MNTLSYLFLVTFQGFLDYCSTGICMNGGRCTQVANNYRCDCQPSYTGQVCDVRMVNCAVAASLRSKYMYTMFSCCYNLSSAGIDTLCQCGVVPYIVSCSLSVTLISC